MTMSSYGWDVGAREITTLAVGRPDGATWWPLLVVLAGLLALASVHTVAGHRRLVVLRRGRVVGVRGPGTVLAVPLLDRTVPVSVRPVRVDPLVVRATTRDGFQVDACASAVCQVAEPAEAAVQASRPLEEAARVVEDVLRQRVAATDLADVLTVLDRREELLTEVRARTGSWGVDVLDLEATDVRVGLSPQLLQWRGPSGAGSPLPPRPQPVLAVAGPAGR